MTKTQNTPDHDARHDADAQDALAHLDEARRLTLEIAELQARLDYLIDSEGENNAETWNVWPYSWAVAGWNSARTCFHSFHQKRERAAENVFEGACPLRLV